MVLAFPTGHLATRARACSSPSRTSTRSILLLLGFMLVTPHVRVLAVAGQPLRGHRQRDGVGPRPHPRLRRRDLAASATVLVRRWRAATTPPRRALGRCSSPAWRCSPRSPPSSRPGRRRPAGPWSPRPSPLRGLRRPAVRVPRRPAAQPLVARRRGRRAGRAPRRRARVACARRSPTRSATPRCSSSTGCRAGALRRRRRPHRRGARADSGPPGEPRGRARRRVRRRARPRRSAARGAELVSAAAAAAGARARERAARGRAARPGRGARDVAGAARRGREASAAGSSATCTTARSSGSSRCRCSSGSRGAGSRRTRQRRGDLLDGAASELDAALEELRELARGIHPAVLTDRGLGAALEALAGATPVPVELARTARRRLPAAVEVAAYFVVAEALTNVAKYAAATHATSTSSAGTAVPSCEVADDGVGGADPDAGTGLRGLADRLAVLDGRLEIDCPPGTGRHTDPSRRRCSHARSRRRRLGAAARGRRAAARGGRVRRRRPGRRRRGPAAQGRARTSRTSRSSTSACRRRTPTTACGRRCEIRAEHPGTGVLVLSQYVEEGYALELLADERGGRRLPAQGPRRGRRALRRRGPAGGGGRLGARPRGRRRSSSAAAGARTRSRSSPRASARCSS